MLMLAITAALAAPTVHVQPGRPTYGSVMDTVDAPIDIVRQVVSDCARLQLWFPDMRDTRVVARLGSGVRCEGVMDLPWPVADRSWHVFIDGSEVVVNGQPAVLVRFAYIQGSGNLADMSGHFRLQAAPGGGTRVTYEAWVDLGFWLPSFVLSWATQRVLPGIIEGIRTEAVLRTAP